MVIKKLNSFFHKHSRIVLGVFALLIIFAFVISDNLPAGGGCSSPADNPVGTVFGEEVTTGEIQQLYKDYALFCQLTGTQANQLDAKNMLELKAMIKRAEDMGISVSDEDIANMIKKSPLFFEGEFSKEKLEKFLKDNNYTMEVLVAEFRQRSGGMASDDQIAELIKNTPQFMDGEFSVKKYDEFIKEHYLSDESVKELVRKFAAIGKMQEVLLASVVVSDAEVQTFYQMHAMDWEVYSFKVAESAAAAPKEEELKALYESQKEMFKTPEAFNLISAVIPVEKYKEDAEKFVTANMVEKAVLVHAGKSKDEIRKILVQQRVEILAMTEAAKYNRAIYDKLDKNIPVDEQVKIFREWAADEGMEVQESGERPFYPFDQMGSMIAQVPADGIQLFRSPVPGEKGMSIVIVAKRVAPVQLTFEECKKQLQEMYKRNKPAENMKKELTAKVEEIKKLSADQQSAALAALGGTMKKVSMQETFTNQLLGSAINQSGVQKVGDISAPVLGGTELMVIRGVKADMKDFDTYKEQIRSQLLRRKQETMLADFQAEISRQCQMMVPEGAEKEQAAEQAE